jgi:F0F1-type ATP synthase membrane subunit a
MSLLDFESINNSIDFAPKYYNTKLRGLAESLDELMDSWSDSAGADETCDSSSTLIFGSCFITASLSGIVSFVPLCTNSATDINLMLTLVEDNVLGTLVTLVPILGFRTYAECINKDTPLVCIPFFVIIEAIGQTSRVISLALRMAANTTASHSLLVILLNYMYMFILYTVGIKLQLVGLFIFLFCTIFLTLDFFISSIQSYIIIILEAYYELDSE